MLFFPKDTVVSVYIFFVYFKNGAAHRDRLNLYYNRFYATIIDVSLNLVGNKYLLFISFIIGL